MSYSVRDILSNPNLIYYAYRRNNWIIDPSRLLYDFDSITIDRPIFLLGTHGGGLTLISRMLRRNENVVSVSGNNNYWSGADEMAVVLGRILPFELGGIKHKVPNHPYIESSAAWVYASDELIDKYRQDEDDVTEEVRETLHRTIKWLIYRHAKSQDCARFTDKSQVYTVRASFISELLRGKNPRFVLVVRNPYALAYRAPEKAAALRQLSDTFSREDKMVIAAQHWKNSIASVLEDAKQISHLEVVKFEDVLLDTKETLKRICDAVDLEYKEQMVPKKHHNVPFGSRYRDRWFPIRPDVNKKYFRRMDESDVETIKCICGKVAEKMGYGDPL